MKIIYLIKKILVALTNPGVFHQIRRTDGRHRAFLMCLPQYVNYGDFAIQIAEDKYLGEFYEKDEIIHVTSNFYNLYRDYLLKHIKKNDTIVITGGGWIGDLWPVMDRAARDILTSFADNRIIIFPQTVFYEEKSENLKTFADICRNHSQLYICLRDRKSYELVSKHMMADRKDHVFLLPDIVTLLEESPANRRVSGRKLAYICFRTDKESVGDKSTLEAALRESLQRAGIRVKKLKMAHERIQFIPNGFGLMLTRRKIRRIGKADLVITDRLHGMLLSAVTGVPCVALDNRSKKVSGAYQWIEHLPYIAFGCKDKMAHERIAEKAAQGGSHYSSAWAAKKYQVLEDLFDRS